MTFPLPKKGRVCSASRSRESTFNASPLFETAASMISWSIPPSSSVHCWYNSLARCLTPNSSSPHTSTSGAACLAGEGGISLLGLAAVLVDTVEHFAHVFNLLEQGIGNVDGA